MKHEGIVQEEFARQSESFRSSPVLSSVELTSPIAQALGRGHGRVLDVACGPGILFPTLASCAEAVVGVDLTLEALKLARDPQRGCTAFVVRASSEVLPFRSDSFDAAVIRLALHHFVDPGLALAAARSVVRAGGRLVVLDLLARSDANARSLRDAIERFRDPSHTRLLTADEMRAQIARAGFGTPVESLWSQRREFTEWARIMNAPERMSDFRLILSALAASPGDPSELELSRDGDELWFTHRWGMFTATAV